MQVFVKTLQGKTIVLDLEEWNTIKDIKIMIQDREGIPFEEIRLSKLGISLNDDNKTITESNISNQSIIEMHLKLYNENYIFIKSEKEKFKLRYNQNETILDIKKKILKEINIPIEKQKLYLSDKELTNNENIELNCGTMLELKYDIYIKVLIKTQFGNLFYIKAKPSDIIEKIKFEIFKRDGIQIIYQKLMLNNITLENLRNLEYYNIGNNTTLNLIIDSKEILVYIKVLIDEKMPIKLKISDNISSIKEAIKNKINQIKFIFNNKELEDNTILYNSNIQENSLLYLSNKKLENENIIQEMKYMNQTLKKKIIDLENNIKKMNDMNKELINNNKKLEQSLKNLKNKKLEYEKIINEQKTTIENFNKNLSLFDGKKNNVEKEILELVKELREKEKEIKSLKSSLPFEINQGEKVMSIIFISVDQKIHHSFICKNTDMFINIEKSLYDIYPEYRESENYFLLRGLKINKYKSLENNNIKDSDIITLNQYN